MTHNPPGWGTHLGWARDRGDGSSRAAPPVLSPDPPRHAATCETCHDYVGPGTPVCGLIELRLEAKAGRPGCCHGSVVAETLRIQQVGGCPARRF